jgi:hypothetical protein
MVAKSRITTPCLAAGVGIEPNRVCLVVRYHRYEHGHSLTLPDSSHEAHQNQVEDLS